MKALALILTLLCSCISYDYPSPDMRVGSGDMLSPWPDSQRICWSSCIDAASHMAANGCIDYEDLYPWSKACHRDSYDLCEVWCHG